LSKLFNLCMTVGYVPLSFGKSYTVPILKDKNAVHCKSLTVDDFCGISISPVISKIFEHCIGTVITLRPVIISSALSKEVAMHMQYIH